MAARKLLHFSATSASCRTSLLRPSLPSSSTNLLGGVRVGEGLGSSSSSPSRRLANSRAFSRIPVELGGAMTLMPMHSATATALLTSLLCLSSRSWGCLSEGFATPL
ncbi:hypothetical protein MLD38_002463 [Melastoma candidum]|uniref:Uncharacterized protein n=1 Tax=Melastoma candidum TaxID=119954 RepID=A0ACB9S3U4_9MYRT|nr:hypothetical protein MLD38_002463 [Melastoma candidum]